MTLVEIQRLLNGTGSVTEVLETVELLRWLEQEEEKRLEAIRLMARLFKEDDEIEKDQW